MNGISFLLNPVPVPPKGTTYPILLICIALITAAAAIGAALLISIVRRKK